MKNLKLFGSNMPHFLLFQYPIVRFAFEVLAFRVDVMAGVLVHEAEISASEIGDDDDAAETVLVFLRFLSDSWTTNRLLDYI